jgi:hypothetical protein
MLVWSAADLTQEIEAGARVLAELGVRPGLRVGNTLPGALATPGALLLGDVNEAIGALDVPLGTIDSDAGARAAWELVDRVACEVLVLDPRTAPLFFAGAPAAPRPWWQGIVWLDPGNGDIRPAAPEGFAGWQRTWLAVPEVACFVGGTCERGLLHVDTGVGADVAAGELILIPRRAVAAPGPYATGIAARMVNCGCALGGPALERRRGERHAW